MSEDGVHGEGHPVIAETYRTNVRSVTGGIMLLPKEAIELIAEFIHDLDVVPFDDWIAEPPKNMSS